MKDQNKAKRLYLILAAVVVTAVAGPAVAGPEFEASIAITGTKTVQVGQSTTLTATWSTNDKNVTRSQWYVDGDGQGVVIIDASSGTSSFTFNASGLEPGAYQVCFRIWHHTQTGRDAVKCVTITVNETEGDVTCQSAFAFGDEDATSFAVYDFSRWGWTNGPLAEGTYEFEIWAAAGQSDLAKGTLVGTLLVEYLGGVATVEYVMDDGFTLEEVHLYVGSEPLPCDKKGEYTVSPGQYPYFGDGSEPFEILGLSGDIFIIAHAVVCGDFSEE